MKLAIDCRMLGSGGIGTYLESLLPFFVKDNECILIGDEKKLEQYDGGIFSENRVSPECTVINCGIKTFSLKEMFSFPRSLLYLINSCDVYYTPYCNIPNGIKVPVFSTIHDVVFLDIPSLTSKIGVIARKFFYQRAINRSHSIFTVSAFSAERIKKHLHLGNKPVVITYNSVPEWFKDDISQPECATDKMTKEDYLLFVGNIKQHKGLHTLLPAFRKVLETKPELKLVIVGNAENFRTGDDTITKEISAFPEGKIVYTGRISNEELRIYYKKARLLVQPSLYEGFGMPPLEALTSGTNVVLSDIPVFKEIYGSYPVHFFETGNVESLTAQILNTIDLPSNVEVPETYSFEKTYSIIYTAIKQKEEHK